MDYYEIIIPVHSPQSDILVYYLDQIGYSGYVEQANGIAAYIEAAKYDEEQLTHIIRDQFEIPWGKLTIRTIPHQNWNEVWEENFKPQVINDTVLVKAPFHNVKKSYPYEVIIEPQMAFGTGHHPTTSMMVQLQLLLDFHDKTVFDYGTGSGLLAILAEKLGAKAIYANEIQEDGIRNARLNIEHNQCDKITLSQQDLEKFPPDDLSYDIILANITRNTILSGLDKLYQLLKPGGYCLASGFLYSEKNSVEEAFQNKGMPVVKSLHEDKWVATLFQKS